MDEPTDNKNGWRYQEHNDYVTATNWHPGQEGRGQDNDLNVTRKV
jgi:hypothetical protein